MIKKQDPERARVRKPLKSLLARPLGLEGWTKLEPVVLAALASEEPLLLVGKHGTAKSFLLERLAKALGLEYRFYNASLINFDDLVGIPMPDEKQESLRYISVPTAVWGAEVVFVDELSRTRPELQNKLFPLIHERRVQGIELEKLRYRWAAMNPPPPLDDLDDEEAYLGSEPLDPALADRFPFVIEVPDWDRLTKVERRRVLLDSVRGPREFQIEPVELVRRAAAAYQLLLKKAPRRVADYLLALTAGGTTCVSGLSTRRVAMLFRTTLAVQAARQVLAEAQTPARDPAEVDLEESAWCALSHGHPDLARKGKIDRALLLTAHRHAWRLTMLGKGDPTAELLGISDPLERFVRAVELGSKISNDDMSQFVLQAVTSREIPAHRTTVALAAYLWVHDRRDVAATTIEMLAREVRRVLVPAERTVYARMNKLAPAQIVGRLVSQIAAEEDDADEASARRNRYLRNLLESLLPDGFQGSSPDEIADLFKSLWGRLWLDCSGPDREEVEA